MRSLKFMCLIAAIAGNAVQAQAADLTKVNRTIAKEPVYESRCPHYCLLVFGPEAEVRVWLVRDGDWLYVDKNGNGDLTETGERVQLKPWSRNYVQVREAPTVEIVVNGRNWGKLELEDRRLHPEFKPLDEDEKAMVAQYQKYQDGILRLIHVSDLTPSPRSGGKPFAAKVRLSAGSDGSGSLGFGLSPKDAPVVHFDGPLTLEVAERRIEKTKEPFDFQVMVGTHGLGSGTFATLAYRSYDAKGNGADVVPEGLHPEAEIAFAATERGRAPARIKWVLKQRC